MNIITIIFLVTAIILEIVGLLFCDDNKNKSKIVMSIGFTLLLVSAVLVVYDSTQVSAEDYINNPSAYSLDTIGTHIRVKHSHIAR